MFLIYFSGKSIQLKELPIIKNKVILIDKELLTDCSNVTEVIALEGNTELAKKFLENCKN